MNFNVSFCNSCSFKMMKVAFSILQGSVDKWLICGSKHDKNYIANFLLNPKNEEF